MARPCVRNPRARPLGSGRGASCSKLLVDAGAEVIEVEPPGGSPFRYASVEYRHRSLAPTLGQDEASVLGDLLGLAPDDLEALAAEGVAGTWPEDL